MLYIIPKYKTNYLIPLISKNDSINLTKGITFGIITYVLCKVVSKKSKEIPFVTWILAFVFLFDIIFEAVKQ